MGGFGAAALRRWESGDSRFPAAEDGRWSRPDPAERPGLAKYVRSYLVIRLGIGVLGIVLPLWLVFADWVAFHGDPHPRGSLSVYYYSGMRDIFVVIMSATGVF